MKNHKAFLMIGISVTLALLAVVLASRWISQQGNISTSKVMVAAVDINLGTRISPELIRSVDWPSGSVPKGSFSDAKALDTRVTRVSLLRGEPLVDAKLAQPGASGGLSAVVAEGKRAMTVRVNDVIGVAGFALPGNFVDILVSTQGEKSGTSDKDLNISKLVLERILVLAVAQEASQNETKPKVVSAVTLEVTPEQAEQLDLARSVGQLSLVLRNQIDLKPAQTAGATKQSLLYAQLPAAPAAPVKPVIQRVKLSHKAALITPRIVQDCQQVMTGAGTVTQCF
ncbi:Flp pilus assembly protein CpaB [Massilia sp. R2A-15]|uniref:Flp pilus assembly protein CpaB n=1 Tax=Massilia sp. R2A-15 TaxID=3064278 RepID=UPI002736E7C1|nr:Flp pilus assembly protein CpaB [Massilia sp. R2A-15]WLI87748.1 Flp pilus assembly protein CpaB [Massilia sp. R2A-15]